MKKKTMLMILAGLLALAMIGCGAQSAAPAATTAAAAATTTAAATTATTATTAAATTTTTAATTTTTAATTAAEEEIPSYEAVTYQSPDGWSVQYFEHELTLEEDGDTVRFVLTEDVGGNGEISFRCIPDLQPEEVLYDVTSAWGNDEMIDRSEGFFPGTWDGWGFWRVLDAEDDSEGIARSALAGEYNGGVLLICISSKPTGDEDADMATDDILSALIDSITYEDFEPQTMFDYVPGRYLQTEQDSDAVGCVILNGNHTGMLIFQDEAEITWGSTVLSAPDTEYEYTIEGSRLYIDLDGEWVEFIRQLPAYAYTGGDPLLDAVYMGTADMLAPYYRNSQVGIPCPVIAEIDDSDPDDIRVIGDFEYFTYEQESDTLVCQAGGSYPGVLHLYKNEDVYEISDFEAAEDGAGFDKSARELFGKSYDAFMKVFSDDEAKEAQRLQIIADYAAANRLGITAVQDAGLDPVELPEAAVWDYEGYFTDEDGNFMSVTFTETDGEMGWYVGCILGEDIYGNTVKPEGRTLRGDLVPSYEEGEFLVTVEMEGENGVMLTTDAGEVYHFTPYEMPEAILSAFINIEGEGEITYAPADGKLEFDDEYPYQSAQISLAEPETYQLGARAADGWVFEKWLKDGEDFSTEAEITVELTEDVEFIAVFVKK